MLGNVRYVPGAVARACDDPDGKPPNRAIREQPAAGAGRRCGTRQLYMSARSLARCIILLRSRASAFLLSLSSSGGICLNAASIAMSFASARWTFICRNSCSILSNVRFDKSFSGVVSGCHYRSWARQKQRRSRQITLAALDRSTAYIPKRAFSCSDIPRRTSPSDGSSLSVSGFHWLRVVAKNSPPYM